MLALINVRVNVHHELSCLLTISPITAALRLGLRPCSWSLSFICVLCWSARLWTQLSSVALAFTSRGIKCCIGRRNVIRLPLSPLTIILAHRTVPSLLRSNISTLANFQKVRHVLSFRKITISPTAICTLLFGRIDLDDSLKLNKYSVLHCLINWFKTRWCYFARLVRDWFVLIIS
jgi:hypothetical protein